jgi:2-(1,2-epoxy-1,2-dihydrophenyl)acetyl-CoA isomerase
VVTVLRELDDAGVLWLTLNRPDKLNAVNDEVAAQLRAYAEEAAADRAVRCVVLTGAGRAFCAGGDITTMGRRDGAAAVERLRGRGRLISALVTLTQPLVVAVNGPAVGGGFSLALTGDVVLADPGAYFQPAFTGLGLSPDLGFTHFLPRQIGVRRALAVALADQRIDAHQALELGIVAEVSPAGRLAEHTRSYARKLAGRSPHALAATKQLIRQSLEHDLATALQLEAFAYGVAVGTEEHGLAVQRFREARGRG